MPTPTYNSADIPREVLDRIGKAPEELTHTELRFYTKVGFDEETGCWPWKACTFKDRGGYGAFGWGGRMGYMTQAHRVSYAFDNGYESPRDVPGDVIMHLCHNAECCNPDHLEPGTYLENHRATIEAGNLNWKFEPDDIREIRRLDAETNLTQEEIGERFDTDQTMISAIVRRKLYDWVD